MPWYLQIDPWPLVEREKQRQRQRQGQRQRDRKTETGTPVCEQQCSSSIFVVITGLLIARSLNNSYLNLIVFTQLMIRKEIQINNETAQSPYIEDLHGMPSGTVS